MKLLNEMTLIPQDYLTLQTALTPAEVAEVLKENTSSSVTLFWRPKESFSGYVGTERFAITRVLRNHRNSFAPRMNGVVIPEGDGSRIEVRLALSPVVAVFTAVWFGGVAFFGVMGLFVGLGGVLAGKIEGVLLLVAPIGMLIFAFLLTHGAFRFEVPKSKQSLCEVLDMVEVEGE